MPEDNREVRYLTVRELRASGEGEEPRISGYAAVFDVLSEDLGGFRERIRGGAFGETLKSGDQKALWNHDTNLVLGSVRAKTLELDEDEVGLRFVIRPPDTQAGRDALASMRRGDVDQMSFAFRTVKDDWQQVGDQIIRTLMEVKLFEVSPVAFPAYPQTSAFVRSQFEEFRTRQGPGVDEAELRQEQERMRIARKMDSRKRKLDLLMMED